MAMRLSGVRPSIFFASTPTAITLLLLEETATTVGSFVTIPPSAVHTKVFAVPRSIAIRFLNAMKLLYNIIVAKLRVLIFLLTVVIVGTVGFVVSLYAKGYRLNNS